MDIIPSLITFTVSGAIGALFLYVANTASRGKLRFSKTKPPLSRGVQNIVMVICVVVGGLYILNAIGIPLLSIILVALNHH